MYVCVHEQILYVYISTSLAESTNKIRLDLSGYVSFINGYTIHHYRIFRVALLIDILDLTKL